MIPNVVHFVYIKERPWKLHHYLSIKSATRLNPEKIRIQVLHQAGQICNLSLP